MSTSTIILFLVLPNFITAFLCGIINGFFVAKYNKSKSLSLYQWVTPLLVFGLVGGAILAALVQNPSVQYWLWEYNTQEFSIKFETFILTNWLVVIGGQIIGGIIGTMLAKRK